jgi:23S rRNA-/tRNA-specific pseudouridylate synthase
VKKKYLALVLGDMEAEGVICTPLAHHPTNPRKMVAVTPGARHRSRVREAQTQYVPRERFGDFTLLEVQTRTGRMHQVRVHLSSVGHPLAGDRLYQTSAERQKDRSGLDRHFLHACRLEFRLPPPNQLKIFESSLPGPLQFLMDELRKR